MRATQFIEYLNQQEHPTGDEGRTLYTHLTFTAGLKAVRRKYSALSTNPAPSHCSPLHEEKCAKVPLLKHRGGI